MDIVEAFRPVHRSGTRRLEIGRGHPRGRAEGLQGRPGVEKPGACHIELPEDVAEGAAEGDAAIRVYQRAPPVPRPRRRSQRGGPTSSNRADRPADPRRQRRHPRARRAASCAPWPSAPQHPGGRRRSWPRAALPADHPLMAHHRRACMRARTSSAAGFAKADLIVAVGYDPVEYAPRPLEPRAEAARIVHIDFTAAEVDALLPAGRSRWSADVREALELLGDPSRARRIPRPSAQAASSSARQILDGSQRRRLSRSRPQRVHAPTCEAALAPEDTRHLATSAPTSSGSPRRYGARS